MKTYLQLIIWIFIITLIACSKEKSDSISSELNVLNIEFDEPIPIHEKIEMKLFETTSTEQNLFNGRIERRGGYSISFEKHSYEIDLKEDISLAGLPADDDWILNANYIDKTFLRHVISYEIFSDMSEINIVSESQYVEVELNEKYNGLYVLMEKLDKSSLELKDSDSLAFIFKEPHIFRESYDGIIPQNEDNFHQQTFPKIKLNDKREYIEGIRDYILKSSNNEFDDWFSIVFDTNNIIDWHLLLLISNNGDGILKNFYLYKIDNDTPIRVAPWDYDHSFGRDGDNEFNAGERLLDIERSILFRRLVQCKWYRTALKQRWEQLNTRNILSASGLKKRILMKSEMIREAANKNFSIWSIDNEWYYDANGFEDEIDIMIKYIDLRHDLVTKYFNEL